MGATTSADTYDVPIVIAVPGQGSSLLGAGTLINDGIPYYANGYLGTKSGNGKFNSNSIHNKS